MNECSCGANTLLDDDEFCVWCGRPNYQALRVKQERQYRQFTVDLLDVYAQRRRRLNYPAHLN